MLFLNPRQAVFRHPHYPSGVLVARLSVSVGTFIWSSLVLAIDSALPLTAYGKVLLEWGFNEDYVALVFLLLSLGNLFCIFRPCRPRKVGILGYIAMLFGWASIFVAFVLKTPLQVTGVTMSFVVASLAFFAVVGGPRRKDCPLMEEENLGGSQPMV